MISYIKNLTQKTINKSTLTFATLFTGVCSSSKMITTGCYEFGYNYMDKGLNMI